MTKLLKHRIRRCIDQITLYSGLLPLFERRMRRGLTILMYHRVLPLAQCIPYPLQSLVIPAESFRQQMAWLREHCLVLPVSEAMVVLQEGKEPIRPLVAVTFDDGYEDNFRLAAPILEELDLRGTFYITTGFVAGGEPLWYDRAADIWSKMGVAEQRGLAERLRDSVAGLTFDKDVDWPIAWWMEALKRTDPRRREEILGEAEGLVSGVIDLDLYQPMTVDQVGELSRKGHEIGSHTVDHPILPQLVGDELRKQLVDSAEYLGKLTGQGIKGFCYPNGDYDDRVEKAVLESGYSNACTTETGVNLIASQPTRLARLSITMQRTQRRDGGFDLLGFRSELCRLRELLRR